MVQKILKLHFVFCADYGKVETNRNADSKKLSLDEIREIPQRKVFGVREFMPSSLSGSDCFTVFSESDDGGVQNC